MKVANDEEAGSGGGEEREKLLFATAAGRSPSSLESSSEEIPTSKTITDAHSAEKANHAFNRLASFSVLVFIGALTQLSFKFSQRGGRYEYNTASAMCLVELIKLCLASLQYRRELAPGPGGSGTAGNRHSAVAPTGAFWRTFRRLPARLYIEYFLLAVSYAVYNQLIFAVMHLSDPGTFSLLKSFNPVLVGIINWQVTGMMASELQWYCVLMQIFGIIPVMRKCGGELVTTPKSLILIMCANSMGALNSVYNSKLIKNKTWDASVSVQNMVLYTFGMTLSFLGYVALGGGSSLFFRGYEHAGVWAMLFLNAFAGVTVSFVYRFGDAVLKTFAQPMSAAIVVYASSFLLNSPLDIVQAAGAGTVVLASLVYLRLPASKNVPTSLPSNKKDDSETERKSSASSVPYVLIAIVVCIVAGMSFILSHSYIFKPGASSGVADAASVETSNSTVTN